VPVTPRPPAAPRDLHLEQVLRLIREGQATTRPALIHATRLSRKVVIQRVEQLVSMGLVRDGPRTASTGGRPPGRLDFADDAGCVLAVELGGTGLTAGLVDLSGRLLRQRARRLPFPAPPGVVLKRADEVFRGLLEDVDRRGPLRGIGIGVLGPVSPNGLAMDISINAGWGDFAVGDWFVDRYGVPVWVDNEVNMMAVGESRSRADAASQHLLYVKVSTGIGAGLISGGTLFRGTSGVAGELGHMTIPGARSLVCWCGNSGCVTAVASGRAIAGFGAEARHTGKSRFLEGVTARQIRDVHVVAGAHAGDKACLKIMTRAGEALGLAIAGATNLMNPAAIVLGGRIGGLAGDLLTRPVRRAVEAHAFPRATETLTIESSEKGYTAGVFGAASTVIDGLLSGMRLGSWQADLEDITAAGGRAG
jgi:predicted NBD/HSP70 family sugar kinase